MVVGNSHKTRIPELLQRSRLVQLGPVAPSNYHGEIHVGDIFAQQDFLAAPVEDSPLATGRGRI